MKFIDLHPHDLLRISREASESMRENASDWPLNYRYHLGGGSTINVESSARRASEGISKLNFDDQIFFWMSVLGKVGGVGNAGKLIEGERHIATVVRLASDDENVVNFRMSP